MMRRLMGLLVGLLLVSTGVASARQATPQFSCSSPSGFGVELAPGDFYLDLQCQPVLNRTLEIAPGGAYRFTVSLSNFYAATGMADADFQIHLAMDRARIMVREADQLDGVLITDTIAAIQDIAVVTDEIRYVFVVENRGLRSAVFDLSVRPR
jgi:hypothetical protein